MKIIHSTGTVTPNGHSAYRGYDATVGKLATFSQNGKGYPCPHCLRRFMTVAARDAHRCGDAA